MNKAGLTFTAHSCSHCENIQVRIPFKSELQTAVNSELTGGVILFAEIPGLRVLTASSSCAFFKWAISAFRKEYKDEDMDDGWTLNGGIHAAHFDYYPSAPFVIFQWWNRGEFSYSLDLTWLAILAEPDDPSSQFISQRPEKRELGSHAAFAQAQRWLNLCQSTHRACNMAANSYMPSYLIEIRSTGLPEPTIRIVANPPVVEYAALSYCWGGSQSVSATNSTIKDLMDNISYSTLPKTLQDAITVTLKLGLRFLWVDALCIIQDDPVQKQQEIASMPSIYQNACVTISADRSKSCDEGFLHDIVTPGPTEIAFKFRFYGPDCTVGSVVCFHSDDKYRYHLNPIRYRAWPLQEFILSRRVLRFGVFQRSWLCLCDGFDEMESVRNFWKDRDNEEALLRKGFHRASASPNTLERETWQHLVESYSIRRMTNPTDRLLGISGMATSLGAKKHDEYLAGIWCEHLPCALLWLVPSPQIRTGRSDIYIAPSWSWAAINSLVQFQEEALIPDPDLKLLSKQIVLSEPKAPYGAVTYGSIAVCGWIRPFIWTEGGCRLSELGKEGVGGKVMQATCFPDYTDSLPAESIVWCLQISAYSEENGFGPFGLILVTEDGQVFYRRGMFEYHHVHYERALPPVLKAIWEEQKSWKEECEFRTVVIE